MTDAFSRTLLAAMNLPPPPRPQRTGGLDTFVVVAIVVAVLGVVVLIAWLLKPIVARRLGGIVDGGDVAVEAGEGWTDARAAVPGRMERRGIEQVPEPAPVGVAVPEGKDDEEEIGVDVVTTDVESDAQTAVLLAVSQRVQHTETASAPDQKVTTDEIAGITLTVRELIDHANAGQLLSGLALYSESFLQRFRAETGLSEHEFAATFEAVPAPPPEARAEIAAITDVDRLPDGRVSALVTYGDGNSPSAPERFIFVRAGGHRWLIDDIIPA